MARDIVLFYYHSSNKLPRSCYLGISDDIAHRNMFLDARGPFVHFEFPTFEDHSYSSICNGPGLKKLIERQNGNDKYIIFRTKDRDDDTNHIIGYYKINKAYYQESLLFDDKGFVWGIEAEPVYLLKKGVIRFNYSGRGYVTSWNNKDWGNKLNNLIDNIETKENFSDIYQKETNYLISIFKDKKKMEEWKTNCKKCSHKKDCKIYKKFKNYFDRYNNDMFNVIYNVYNSNIYSKNSLDKIKKNYLKI